MNIHKSYRIFLALICLTLALVLTVGNVNASPTQQAETDFAAIDAYVNEQMNNLGIPGMALGIVQNGQIAHMQGFGVADSSGRAVTPQTPFRIGSLTKAFTALAVMQLVESGKIDLDAPVQTYLPWFELADKEAAATITVRNLLNQTSGMSTKDGNRFWRSQEGLEATIRGLSTIQLTQPVGTTYQYCNINFMIAGLIIEKVSGQPYADYMAQNIFAPLDMHKTYTSPTLAKAGGLSEGHIYMFGHVFINEGPMPPANLPAGTLMVSVEDMAHYTIAQLNGGNYGDKSVLSPQGIDNLHTPAIPTRGDEYYAMGWNVGKLEGNPYFSHSGDDGRFHSVIFLQPEQGSGIILLANATGFTKSDPIDQIARGVVFMLNGQPAESVAAPFLAVLLYWLTLLTPLLMLLGIPFIWRRFDRLNVWGAVITLAVYLGLVIMLFQLALQIITLSSMLVFYPDIGYALVATAAIGIGWSVICSGMYLRKRLVK